MWGNLKYNSNREPLTSVAWSAAKEERGNDSPNLLICFPFIFSFLRFFGQDYLLKWLKLYVSLGSLFHGWSILKFGLLPDIYSFLLIVSRHLIPFWKAYWSAVWKALRDLQENIKHDSIFGGLWTGTDPIISERDYQKYYLLI